MNKHRIGLIISLVANGCGKDPPSTPAGNAPMAATAAVRKPCEYVKRADAEKATGLVLPNMTEDENLHECRFLTADFQGATVGIGDWAQCKTALDSLHPSAVAGLGDEALFVREHLFIRKFDRCVSVEINGPQPDADKDDGLARVKELALTVLATL